MKSLFSIRRHLKHGSPSLGREWIEIPPCGNKSDNHGSPSLGREWIEIVNLGAPNVADARSPSLGREWIEIRTDLN